MARYTAEDARADTEREVEIAPGKTVLVERRDLITMFLEGLLPMELLNAMQRLLDKQPIFADSPAALASFPENDRKAVVEMLRRFACTVVTDPIFVLEPDDHPDHVPVIKLTSKQLLDIWAAAHQLMGIDPAKAATAGGPAAAERFPEPDEHEQPDGAPASDGEDVSPPPEQLVDTGGVEMRFG